MSNRQDHRLDMHRASLAALLRPSLVVWSYLHVAPRRIRLTLFVDRKRLIISSLANDLTCSIAGSQPLKHAANEKKRRPRREVWSWTLVASLHSVVQFLLQRMINTHLTMPLCLASIQSPPKINAVQRNLSR